MPAWYTVLSLNKIVSVYWRHSAGNNSNNANKNNKYNNVVF